jgi:hypothetical protein
VRWHGEEQIVKIRATGRNLAIFGAAVVLLAGCASKDDKDTSGAAAAAATKSAAPADNGVAALEPPAIVDKAKAALKTAKSFHMKGAISDEGQETALDLKISGSDVIGSMTISKAKVELLRVGGKQYMKPSAAFWKMTAAAQADTIIQVVGDRWVVVPASNKDLGGLFTVTDVDQILDPDGTLTKGPVKPINGTPAISLVEGGSDGGTLYVATTGEPYPLKLAGPTAADGGLDFTEFGETFSDLKAPAATDTLDLSKIGS